MSKRVCNLLVFTIGVIMLLLRPYIIYQLTQKTAANDPAKTYRLLQRLVKKKEDHHEFTETAATVTQRSRFSFQPVVLRIKAALYSLASVFTFLSLMLQAVSYCRIAPQNHRYRLVSCFRI